SPGVLAIFALGLFWKPTTPNAALAGALLTIPISTVLKFLPVWSHGAFPDFPFLDRMAITFIVIVIIMVIMSLAAARTLVQTHTIKVDQSMFKVSNSFVVGSIIIVGILTALYTVYW